MGRNTLILPSDVYDFIAKTGLLATNHGGWFDKHGFTAINPMCAWANNLLEKTERGSKCLDELGRADMSTMEITK